MKIKFCQSTHNPMFFYIIEGELYDPNEKSFIPYIQKAVLELKKDFKSLHHGIETTPRFSFDDPADEAAFTLVCNHLEMEIIV